LSFELAVCASRTVYKVTGKEPSLFAQRTPLT
jgi:hypothetical protein